jgi:uncharacterized protein (TIGR02996 family)
MDSEAQFVAAIAASPDDALLLRAFADWLEERGDRRAPWVRLTGVRSRRMREWMGPAFEDPIPKMIAALKKGRRVMAVRHAAEEVGAAMVPELIALLKHERPDTRRQAIWCLRRIGKAASEALPALMEALKDADSGVRGQAGTAIKEIGARKGREAPAGGAEASGSDATNEAFDGLVARLGDADPATRLAAVNGLDRLGTPDVIAPLCRALADADPPIRHRAAIALWAQLGRNRTSEALEPLRAALGDAAAQVSRAAIRALGEMKEMAAPAVDDLLAILTGGPEASACQAAEALGLIAAGDGHGLEALHQATRGPSRDVALAAARAMGNWQRLPPESADVLLALFARFPETAALVPLGRLERPTPAVMAVLREQVRDNGPAAAGAARALAVMGAAGAEAIPELAGAVGRHWYFHEPAHALARMGEPGLTRLVGLLGSPLEQARGQALDALRGAGEAAALAVPRLREMLREGGADVYRHLGALRTLRAIGPRAADAAPEVMPFLRAETYGEEDEATQTLAAFGTALLAHLPALVALLREPSHLRAHARVARLMAGLAALGADLLEPLREALRVAAVPNDGNNWHTSSRQRTRLHAARGLGELGAAAAPAVPELLPLLSDADAEVRRAAAEALGKGRSPLAADGLRAALRDKDEKVRVRAAEALGLIGEASAAGELTAALRDASARVRREAATALGKVRARDEASLAALRLAERDADKAVRREAAAALKRIEGRPRKTT